MKKTKESLMDLAYILRGTSIYIKDSQKDKRERERGREFLWRNNNQKFPKSEKIDIQEIQRTPTKVNPKRTTSRHITIKLSNSRDRRSWKQLEESNMSHTKGASIGLSDFSAEHLKARRSSMIYFKYQKNSIKNTASSKWRN